jgi:hypothetical protein
MYEFDGDRMGLVILSTTLVSICNDDGQSACIPLVASEKVSLMIFQSFSKTESHVRQAKVRGLWALKFIFGKRFRRLYE